MQFAAYGQFVLVFFRQKPEPQKRPAAEAPPKPTDKKGSVNEFLGKVGAGDRAYFSTTNYYMIWPRAPASSRTKGEGREKDMYF